jgi:hypothetical protein
MAEPPLAGICADYGIHGWRWGETACSRCGAEWTPVVPADVEDAERRRALEHLAALRPLLTGEDLGDSGVGEPGSDSDGPQ